MMNLDNPLIKMGISSFFSSGAVKVLGKTREGHLIISLKEERLESERILIKDVALKRIILENMGAKQ